MIRVTRHTSEWWQPTGLPVNKVSVPNAARNEDPLTSDIALKPRLKGRVGSFAHSRKWTAYNRLQAIDVGYIVPLYDLRDIAKRYGLNHNGSLYFRKHILPEPFDLVRRRSVVSYHWSRFVLVAMDVVLKDLERLGYHQFLSSFEGHLDNLYAGVEYLEKLYEYSEATRKDLSTGDKYGVSWLND